MISLPFILTAGVLALAVFFAAPTAMTYLFYLTNNVASNTSTASGDESSDMATDDSSNSGNEEQSASPEGESRSGRGGGFDREAFFAERDTDGNDKLEGDEISERMRERMADADADKDGAISKEEFMASAGQRGGGGGRPGGRPTADDSDQTAPTESTTSETTEAGQN